MEESGIVGSKVLRVLEIKIDCRDGVADFSYSQTLATPNSVHSKSPQGV